MERRGAEGRLAVEELLADPVAQDGGREAEVEEEIGAEGAVDELIEGIAIPPAIDIGLAEADGAAEEDAAVEAIVVNANIPAIGAVDCDTGPGKGFNEAALERGCEHGRGSWGRKTPEH